MTEESEVSGASELAACPNGCTTAAMIANAADNWHVRYIMCGCGWRAQEFVEKDPSWAEAEAIAAWQRRTPAPASTASEGVDFVRETLMEFAWRTANGEYAVDIDDAAQSLAALAPAQSDAGLREALERIVKEADEPRKFWSKRIGDIARAALASPPEADAVREAVLAERERCALEAEKDYTPGYGRTNNRMEEFAARQRRNIAERIRAPTTPNDGGEG